MLLGYYIFPVKLIMSVVYNMSNNANGDECVLFCPSDVNDQ